MLAKLTEDQSGLMKKPRTMEVNIVQTDKKISNHSLMAELENDCSPLAGLREDANTLH